MLLQRATGITKCDNFITKCDRYNEVGRLLQSATEHGCRCHLMTGRLFSCKDFAFIERNYFSYIKKNNVRFSWRKSFVRYFILLASVYSNYAIIFKWYFTRVNKIEEIIMECPAQMQTEKLRSVPFFRSRAPFHTFSRRLRQWIHCLYFIHASKFYATVEVHPYIVWCA